MNFMQVTPIQAETIVAKYLQAKVTVMLSGSPGIGKSSIIKAVASNFGLKVIDLRLAQCDPTDLLGMPTIVGGRSAYAPFNTFPIEGDSIPEGCNGWLIFLDEFNSASTAVVAAAYKLILDRMVGIHHLHKNVAIVCAGNLETDNAIVQPMSTAMQSRLAHLELVCDVKEWVDWAASFGIDSRITSYINFKPGNLYTFEADHSDKTYACPRTWQFAHDVLKVTDVATQEGLIMLSGVISEGVAREFAGFCKIYQNLPTIEQIAANPKGIAVPVEPSILFALTGSLSHNATAENLTTLMEFIIRLPIEFQVVCVRETLRRHTQLKSHKAAIQWITKSAVELF